MTTFARFIDPIRRRARRQHVAPALAPGLELIGQYQDSGLQDAPWLVRRADGQVVQLSRLLFVVAESLSYGGHMRDVARRVGAVIDRVVTVDNVSYLIENKLGPLGVLAGAQPAVTASVRGPLQLSMRARLVPPRLVDVVTRLLAPLFNGGLVGAALALLVVADVWLFAHHGVTRAFHELIARPEFVVVVFGLVVTSILFHELGHASACRYGGARPGVIGVGLYLVYPAFYTDVTDAYRLNRAGRVRTDLGGVYFNGLFSLGLFALYWATGFEILLLVVVLEHLLVLNQFWPWLRLDGYYVLNDLTGVPDVLSRVRPVLRSLLPHRPLDPRAAELKPWVRRVLTVYALLLVPMLGLLLFVLLRAAPKLLAAAWAAVQAERVTLGAAAATHDWSMAAVSAVRTLLLVLPAAGLVLGLFRLLLRLSDRLARRFGMHRTLRAAFAIGGIVLLATVMSMGSRGGSDAAAVGKAGPAAVPSARDFGLIPLPHHRRGAVSAPSFTSTGPGARATRSPRPRPANGAALAPSSTGGTQTTAPTVVPTSAPASSAATTSTSPTPAPSATTQSPTPTSTAVATSSASATPTP